LPNRIRVLLPVPGSPGVAVLKRAIPREMVSVPPNGYHRERARWQMR